MATWQLGCQTPRFACHLINVHLQSFAPVRYSLEKRNHVCMWVDTHRKILMDLHQPYSLISTKGFRKTLLSSAVLYLTVFHPHFLLVMGRKQLGIGLAFKEYIFFLVTVSKNPVEQQAQSKKCMSDLCMDRILASYVTLNKGQMNQCLLLQISNQKAKEGN